MPMSSFLSAGATQQRASRDAPASSPPPTPPPGLIATEERMQRNNLLTVIGGVGVLLLAMGVGVLIGRAGASEQSAPPASVITVASQPSTSSASGTAEASFVSDWPSGTSGYTVQLQTLPHSGTSVSAVESAKTAASGKGASAVGALASEEFSSLPAGSYVIYSGVYHQRAEAEKALGALKKNFPGAKVIQVSSGGASAGASGAASAGKGAGGSGAGGQSPSHPAPPSALNSLKGAKGKSYSEKSKSLPNVVETG
jgi:hypothetical protein